MIVTFQGHIHLFYGAYSICQSYLPTLPLAAFPMRYTRVGFKLR